MRLIKRFLLPIEDMVWWRYYLRIVWIAIRVILAYALATRADPFFYQAF